MKYIKIYALTLVISFIFVFLGGWMLFDFSSRFYAATAACAFVAASVISAFVYQSGKIEKLEKRIKELEDKNNFSL